MDDAASYPTIEPANFDLIVIGTGLPESIIAAAASVVGKTVLHIDPNPYYGSHFASLPLHDFTEFLNTYSRPSAPGVESDSSGEFSVLPLTTRPVYSDVETSVFSPEVLEKSNKFSLDLSGPRVLFCADAMIDLILKTEINHYMEFKSVDASFICEGETGNLLNVPDSRSAIFKDKSLSFTEKNQLMRFIKLVQEHFDNGSNEESKKISEEDLESPFVEFLSRKIGLSPKLKSIILYAIAMANYEQDTEICRDVIKTKDGIDRLILYQSSVGRFPNAPGAMIYPLYGQGELPQAFCRRAAVKGSLYVLRMPVVGLLTDKEVGSYKGVKFVSGQELFSHKLILAPSFLLPSGLALSSSHPQPDGYHDFGLQDGKEKVVRGICITKSSLKLDIVNCLVFYPPRSLCVDQLTSVRVFQLSSYVAACPPGMFVVYLSTVCEDVGLGKKTLHEAINTLFSIPVSDNSEKTSDDCQNENTVVKLKPSLLWSSVYLQELPTGAFDCVSSTFMPDGNLQYNNLLDATNKLFCKMYPNEDFFPKTTSSYEAAEDGVYEQLDS